MVLERCTDGLYRSTDGPPEKTIFSYLLEDHGANKLAQFHLVVGKGELQHTRLVQKELLYALSPSLASTDQILIPEGSKDTLKNLTLFLYHGR